MATKRDDASDAVNKLPSIALLFAGVLFAAYCAFAEAPDAKRQRPTRRDAAREAMRLLKAECFACHNEAKKKGGLVLTSREALLKGGDDGAVVEPGKADSSRLAKALLRGADPHMPPKKQLTDAQIKVIREWIKGGLAWDAKVLADDEANVAPVALASLPASYQPVMALALAPDGKKLAVGRGNLVVVYDAARTNFPVLAQWEAHRDAVQALAWSLDGNWLASGSFRRLALWNVESFRLEREWTNGLLGRVTAVEFSPDGAGLALADGITGQSGLVRVINLSNGHIAAAWRAHDDTIFDIDFSRGGKQLVTAGGDKLIKVWDLDYGSPITSHQSPIVASKKELARLEGHTAQVLGVAFNTNATQVVSAGVDKQIKVWDLKTGERIISLGNHSSAITAVAWPGDGNTILATTDGGDVFTYTNLKPHTGEQSSRGGDEKKIGEADEAVLSVAISSDAKTIFAGTHDGFVHVWNSERKLLAKLAPPDSRRELGSPEPPDGAAARSSRVPRSSPNPHAASRKPQLTEASSRGPRPAGNVVSLSAEPSELRLSADAPRHGIVFTASTTDGFEVDVTDRMKFSAGRRAPFDIGEHGAVRAVRPGEGVLVARWGSRRVEVPVRVDGTATSPIR